MSVNSYTIVIIEDDVQTVALFNHMLLRSCINLVSISSNDLYQLDTLLQNHQPMLIILDYMSIRCDYAGTVQRLQSSAPNVPTVIITTIDHNTFSSSFDYAIRKPFYKSDILMIIQDVIQRSF